MAERFERNARTMSLLTIVSRVTGLVRDAGLARAFGVGPLMDAFSFAFMIPNLFRRLFGEGALSAAFVPRYAELVRDDPEAARRFAGRTLRSLAILLWGLVVVGELALLALWLDAPAVEVTTSAPICVAGLPLQPVSLRYTRLAYELAMLMLPYMPFVCLVALGGGALQTHGRFGPTAASPILLNLLLIAATLGLVPLAASGSIDPVAHVRIVACAVLVAGALQLAWTMRALRPYRPDFTARDPASREDVRGTVRAAGPMMLGLGVLQLNTFVDGLIASWPTVVGPTIFGFAYPLAEGAMSALANAQRIYEFPLGVFGISIATAVFPLLATQNADPAAFVGTVRRALRMTLFVGLPASLGLMLVGREAIATILQGGEFGPDDTDRVAWILAGYAPAIWSYQSVHVLARAFYARRETMTPVRISLAMVALNFALNIALIFTPLREAGLAWSTAICSVLQAAIMLAVLSRRTGRVIDAETVGGFARTVLATAAMGVAVAALGHALPADRDWATMALRLAALVSAGGVAYLGAARLLAMPELGWTVGRRLGGRR
ncbi:MAG: murein biosynthesis integral membrane protein MurJ [Planctomycetota bacterium]